MLSKSIFGFITLGLLTLTKTNGYILNNYTGKCNDIYTYLEDQRKRGNFNGCEMNDKGEVTGLKVYAYCLKNEQLTTILSYSTIEYLEFSQLFLDWGIDDSNDYDIITSFGCASLPTDYKKLSTLANLKNLDLTGVKNMDINVINNIPKSVQQLELGRVKLTQEMVNALSKLTNLNSLSLFKTEISEELDFSKFTNLKNLSFLEIDYDESYYSSPANYVQGNILMNFKFLKKLIIRGGNFDNNSLNGIIYMTKLEELELINASFTDNTNFSSLKNLKDLTALNIKCNGKLKSFSSNFSYLTNLKRLSLSNCDTTIPTSSDSSLTWTNLKNLETLSLSSNSPTTFDLKNLGDIPSLKYVYLFNNKYTTIPESIGNLKNLETLEISGNTFNSLPKSIGNLKNLKVLRLTSNKLTSLPDEIGNLKNLENLEFAYNEITSVPKTLGNLVNPKKLDGEGNNIINIPINTGDFPKLEELSLSNNRITELPKSIGNLNLTYLSLQDNQISKIPDEIGNLKNLQIINLSHNSITKIPSSLGNLKNLNSLYLDSNLIDDYLPESLNNLPKLRDLYVQRNINIKGKTLSNPNLVICNYYPPLEGHSYSICDVAIAKCEGFSNSPPKC